MTLEKIFVDTNILLDWLGKRHPYFKFAKELFRKAEDKEVEIFISTVFIAVIEANYTIINHNKE